jgi:hypothetical protein
MNLLLAIYTSSQTGDQPARCNTWPAVAPVAISPIKSGSPMYKWFVTYNHTVANDLLSGMILRVLISVGLVSPS